MNCSGELHDGEVHSTIQTVLTTNIMPMIALLSVLSNGVFVIAVSRLAHMRTPTNYYLISLAIVDTLDVCCAVADKLLLFLSSPVVGNEVGYGSRGVCRAAIFVTSSWYFISLFLTTLVSFERFYAVCHPLRVASSHAGRKAVRAIVCTCLFAMLLSATFMPLCGRKTQYCVSIPLYEEEDSRSTYYYSTAGFEYYETEPEWLSIYIKLCRISPFFMTLIANSIFYVRIIRALGRQVAAMESHGQANAGSSIYARNMVARMLVVSGISYFILLAPYEVTELCSVIGELRGGIYILTTDQALLVKQVTRILSYINSATNPFIYGIINRKYREAYRLAFRCKTV